MRGRGFFQRQRNRRYDDCVLLKLEELESRIKKLEDSNKKVKRKK